MVEAGMLVVAVISVVSLRWYGQANARFSERVIGYDATKPTRDWRGVTGPQPRRGGELRRALRERSSDPETERWRVLMHRRLRIFLFDALLVFAVPLLFGLIGVVAALLAGGGWVGYAWLIGLVGLLAYWAFRLAQVLFDYGSGRQLDWRALGMSAGGLGVVVMILVAVVLVRAG